MTNTAAPAPSTEDTLANVATCIVENTAMQYSAQAGNPANADWAMPLTHDLALELNRRRHFEARVRNRRTSRLNADLAWLAGEKYRVVHAELVRRATR
jgi:hypothetical protein